MKTGRHNNQETRMKGFINDFHQLTNSPKMRLYQQIRPLKGQILHFKSPPQS